MARPFHKIYFVFVVSVIILVGCLLSHIFRHLVTPEKVEELLENTLELDAYGNNRTNFNN